MVVLPIGCVVLVVVVVVVVYSTWVGRDSVWC